MNSDEVLQNGVTRTLIKGQLYSLAVPLDCKDWDSRNWAETWPAKPYSQVDRSIWIKDYRSCVYLGLGGYQNPSWVAVLIAGRVVGIHNDVLGDIIDETG